VAITAAAAARRFRAAFAASFTSDRLETCARRDLAFRAHARGSGAVKPLHQQATVATNAAAGLTLLCPKPSEWTGTALAADVDPG